MEPGKSTKKSGETSHPPRVAYRLKEFADATGIPYSTVHAQCRDGKIPTVMFGEIRVIPATYVDRLLNAA